MTNKLAEDFKKARSAGVPLIAVETPDPSATIATMYAQLSPAAAALSWDVVRGARHLNESGELELKEVARKSQTEIIAFVNLVTFLDSLRKASEDVCVFLHNAQYQLKREDVVQAVWNLRDHFKKDGRTLVMLGPEIMLPSALSGDVIIFDEPLPTPEQLRKEVSAQYKNAKLKPPTEDVMGHAVEALAGLPAFAAEQSTALSLTTAGVDLDSLWTRKRKAIEQTPGLKVWRAKPGDTLLAELIGIENAKRFMQRLIDANAFDAIVFMDELDKGMAGGMSDYSGDSGVAKDQVGVTLTRMEDTGAIGVLLAGVAGTGKTQLVKAIGAASGKPLIVFDLGAMKGGVVGESETKVRAAWKVIEATAPNGRVLVVGTANKTTSFSPEMNRRFADQFFFDLLSDEARAALWAIYGRKCGLTPEQMAFPEGMDAGWTGAEIKRTCERTRLFKSTIGEAGQYLVPSAISAQVAIARLRDEADGRFLSASKPGVYKKPSVENEDVSSGRSARKMTV